MDFLQIRFGHLKLTSAMPGLSNFCKMRFKLNIAGIFKIDIYRVVGVILKIGGPKKHTIYASYLQLGTKADGTLRHIKSITVS